MADQAELEARLAAVEARLDEVAADAAAARHLAAAGDRDLADLGVRVDAHRATINGLGVQTAARFDGVEQRLTELGERVMDLQDTAEAGFTEVRGKLDQTAAGLQRIVDLLTPGAQS